MAKSLLKKKNNKVSLNIKISSELDEKLKRLRLEARNQGAIFNVSALVVDFLEKELKKVEKELQANNKGFDSSGAQLDLADPTTWEKT